MRKTKNLHGDIDGYRKSWKLYMEHLVQYFAANDVKSADKKHAILLSVCGLTTYQLIRNILVPAKPTKCTFPQLVEAVEQHRNPKPSAIVQRYNFNTRKQQPGESISTCSFGDTLKVTLRDRIVCGISDTGRHYKNSSGANSTSCKLCGGQHPASGCKHRHTTCPVLGVTRY